MSEKFEAWSKTRLNDLQGAFCDYFFQHRDFVTMLQGPPGTGKTTTLAFLVVKMAFLKMRTAYCAPSNTATEQGLKSIISILNAFCEDHPEARGVFKLVLVPKNASTKHAFETLGPDQASKSIVDSADEETADEFKEFQLWTHVINSIRRRHAQKIGEVEKANNWLLTYEKLTNGATVTRKEKESFVEFAMAEANSVMTDKSVRIVVSTNSNADLLVEHGFKPQAVVIDEAAFATEQDCMVPLSLGARYNVLGGDHEQLKPIVRSKMFNMLCDQLKLSVYERMYGHHNIPLFRLKHNYRMHPDIADLPGMLTYEWLSCDPSTEVITDQYRFLESWWNSEKAAMYRDNTRKPAFDAEPDKNFRVRWFNTKNSFASAKPGSTSLRNFVNINCIADIISSMLYHQPSDTALDLIGTDIKILSHHKDSLIEIRKQVAWSLNNRNSLFLCYPESVTIGKIQGGEGAIVFLEITAHHTSLLGFMKEWNHINVAITRAKDALYIVGNLDAFRSQFLLLVKGLKCKKLALMMVDYLDHGRVIDVVGIPSLPSSQEEQLLDPEQWTNVQNPPAEDDLKITEKHKKLLAQYKPEDHHNFEVQLHKELQALREKAADFKARAAAGENFNLSLVSKINGEDEDEVVEDEEEQTS